MNRYIDADKLEKRFNEILDNPKEYDKPIHDMMLEFYFAPTEDVEPVRHGKWMKAADDGVWSYTDAYAECDQCHMVAFNGWSMNYCPNCGAKMDGESDG